MDEAIEMPFGDGTMCNRPWARIAHGKTGRGTLAIEPYLNMLRLVRGRYSQPYSQVVAAMQPLTISV